MSSIKERARKFMQKYDIKLLSESKICMRQIPQTSHFVSAHNKDYVMDEPVRRDTEPLITVDIPLSKLNEIANIEAIFFDNIDDSQHRRIFQRWIDQQHEEQRLRASHPSVQKAYEHYSAMLAWCGRPNPKITDLPPESS